jgi:hypothetical protein
VAAVAAAFPHVLIATDSARPLDDVPEEASWLLDRAAIYRQTRGEPREALALSRRAYALRRDRLGEDYPMILGSASNLARCMSVLGEYQQVRILHEDTLTRCRRVLGDDHPDTLNSASNLAASLSALVEREQAHASIRRGDLLPQLGYRLGTLRGPVDPRRRPDCRRITGCLLRLISLQSRRWRKRELT